MNYIKAKVTNINQNSITVNLETGESFILPFERYGYFRYCTIREIENITCDGFALEWPDAMIDLELDLLRHPDKEGEPTSIDKWLAFRDKLRKQAAIRENAAKGGASTSQKKIAASRLNGRKGGRPKKKNKTNMVEV